MKRVLGLLLALCVMFALTSVPTFSQPQDKKEKGEKGEKKKGEGKKGEKGEKGEKKKGEGKKKGEKKDQ